MEAIVPKGLALVVMEVESESAAGGRKIDEAPRKPKRRWSSSLFQSARLLHASCMRTAPATAIMNLFPRYSLHTI
jgi:hypothetical protein